MSSSHDSFHVSSTETEHLAGVLGFQEAVQLIELVRSPTESLGTRTPPLTTESKIEYAAVSLKMRTHSKTKKRTLRNQVRELQATVNELQALVDEAATKVQQITEFVTLYVQQQHQQQQETTLEAERRQSFEKHEMEMGIGEQQRQLKMQIKREYEQYLHHQQLERIQLQLLQQQCLESQSPLPQQAEQTK
ncbi:hypothetical protein PHYPSEUDO_006595 [Phytophthora pseudosyringae]|uniref:Uncharacterized protein n=1 Tax=Phytophthora pseudosyringae TaxID=221518 RepID=A0A8T1VI52_9STRA|nr:hypothetical protein PHYPSEUDO_006595 [Phytophthora pseudosyringae]